MGAVYIVDIDGTIADDRERKLRAGPEPERHEKKAYLKWLDAIQSVKTLSEDSPVPGMAELLRGLSRDQAIIIYLTAREEKFRDVTRDWLRQHTFPMSLLLMRPTGGWMSSRTLKEAHIREIREVYANLAIVAIDDDGSGDCAQMYADLDIPHLHMKLAPKKKA